MKKARNSRIPAQILEASRSIVEGAIHEDRGANNAPLVVCASNESRFVSTNFNTSLTSYSVGWTDPENLDDLLEWIAPECPVGRRFDWKRADNNEIFLTEVDDIRAIGAAFKRVEYNGDEVTSKTFNKGLTIRVDNDEEIPDWQKRYTALLLQRLIRNDLRRAVLLLLAAGNNTAVTWNAAANPDSDLRHMVDRTKLANGLRANRVIMGNLAWGYRMDSYEADTNNTARFLRAERTPEQVAAYMMVGGGLKVSDAVYQSGATTKADIVGAVAAAYYARSGLTKDDPSHIKRFVTPTAQGKYRVYVEEHDKYTDISVEHYSNNIITVATGIEKLTVSPA